MDFRQGAYGDDMGHTGIHRIYGSGFGDAQDTRLKKYLSFGTLPGLTLSVFSLGAEAYAGLLSITEELVIAYLA